MVVRDPARSRRGDLPQRICLAADEQEVKPILEILAGIPFVAIGFFALFFVLTKMIHAVLARTLPRRCRQIINALAPSIVVGIMMLPMIASLSEDAMRGAARPARGGLRPGGDEVRRHAQGHRAGGAIGLMASFILAISRAVGETMACLLAAGKTAGHAYAQSARQHSNDDRLHRDHGDRRHRRPARSTTTSVFAVGTVLFADDPGDEPDLDPFRAQVPAGLRMTGGPDDLRSAPAPGSRPRARERRRLARLSGSRPGSGSRTGSSRRSVRSDRRRLDRSHRPARRRVHRGGVETLAEPDHATRPRGSLTRPASGRRSSARSGSSA